MGGALEGRVAIVTGGGRGIGREIALSLAHSGAAVVVADNGTGIGGVGEDRSVAEEIADMLGSNGLAWAGDISGPGAAEALVAAAIAKFGAVDIVVNNAAILRPGLIFKSDSADWDRTLDVNLKAAYRLLAAAAPVMRRQFREGRGGGAGWGRVVNIGSTVGFLGNPGQAAYAASKAGLFALMRVAALELSPCRITANLVAPFAGTRVSASQTPAADQEQHRQKMMDLAPRHIAPVVSWLCSDRAASVSGQVFAVCGREIMLLSQPRPVAAIVAAGENGWLPDDIDDSARAAFGPHYADLIADRDAFVGADAEGGRKPTK